MYYIYYFVYSYTVRIHSLCIRHAREARGFKFFSMFLLLKFFKVTVKNTITGLCLVAEVWKLWKTDRKFVIIEVVTDTETHLNCTFKRSSNVSDSDMYAISHNLFDYCYEKEKLRREVNN